MYFRLFLMALFFVIPLYCSADKSSATIAYVAFSKPDQTTAIGILDTESHQYLDCVKGSKDLGSLLTLSPDKKTLYVIGRSVLYVDTATNIVVGEIKNLPDAYVKDMAISPDGKKGYISFMGDKPRNNVFAFDTSTNTITNRVNNLDQDWYPVKVLFSPTSNQAYIFSANGPHSFPDLNRLSFVDTNTDTVRKFVYLGTDGTIPQHKIAMSKNGNKIYYTIGDRQNVEYYNPNHEDSVYYLSKTGQQVVPSPDGKRVYIQGNEGRDAYIYFFDVATDTLEAKLPLPDPTISAFAITPDSKYIYRAHGSDIDIYDISMLKKIGSINFPFKVRWIYSITFLEK